MIESWRPGVIALSVIERPLLSDFSAPVIFVQLRILQTRAGKMPAAKWHLSIVASGPPNNHHSVCHFTALSTYWHPPGIVSGHHTAL